MLHKCHYLNFHNKHIYFAAIHMAIVDSMTYCDAFLWCDDVTKKLIKEIPLYHREAYSMQPDNHATIM